MQAVRFLLCEFRYNWRVYCFAVVAVTVTLTYWLRKVKWLLLNRMKRRHCSLIDYLRFTDSSLRLIDWSHFQRILLFSVLLIYNRPSTSPNRYLRHPLLMIGVKLFTLPARLGPRYTVVITIQWISVIHIFLQLRDFIFGRPQSFNEFNVFQT